MLNWGFFTANQGILLVAPASQFSLKIPKSCFDLQQLCLSCTLLSKSRTFVIGSKQFKTHKSARADEDRKKKVNIHGTSNGSYSANRDGQEVAINENAIPTKRVIEMHISNRLNVRGRFIGGHPFRLSLRRLLFFSGSYSS